MSQSHSPGNFSVSLPVADLTKSRAFYEHLGFACFFDQSAHGYVIMKAPGAIIGLFENMLEEPILTFNPGWDENAQPVEGFTDIREIQAHLESAGIAIEAKADPASTGPARCLLRDPDGHAILLDQHV